MAAGTVEPLKVVVLYERNERSRVKKILKTLMSPIFQTGGGPASRVVKIES